MRTGAPEARTCSMAVPYIAAVQAVPVVANA